MVTDDNGDHVAEETVEDEGHVDVGGEMEVDYGTCGGINVLKGMDKKSFEFGKDMHIEDNERVANIMFEIDRNVNADIDNDVHCKGTSKVGRGLDIKNDEHIGQGIKVLKGITKVKDMEAYDKIMSEDEEFGLEKVNTEVVINNVDFDGRKGKVGNDEDSYGKDVEFSDVIKGFNSRTDVKLHKNIEMRSLINNYENIDKRITEKENYQEMNAINVSKHKGFSLSNAGVNDFVNYYEKSKNKIGDLDFVDKNENEIKSFTHCTEGVVGTDTVGKFLDRADEFNDKRFIISNFDKHFEGSKVVVHRVDHVIDLDLDNSKAVSDDYNIKLFEENQCGKSKVVEFINDKYNKINNVNNVELNDENTQKRENVYVNSHIVDLVEKINTQENKLKTTVSNTDDHNKSKVRINDKNIIHNKSTGESNDRFSGKKKIVFENNDNSPNTNIDNTDEKLKRHAKVAEFNHLNIDSGSRNITTNDNIIKINIIIDKVDPETDKIMKESVKVEQPSNINTNEVNRVVRKPRCERFERIRKLMQAAFGTWVPATETSNFGQNIPPLAKTNDVKFANIDKDVKFVKNNNNERVTEDKGDDDEIDDVDSPKKTVNSDETSKFDEQISTILKSSNNKTVNSHVTSKIDEKNSIPFKHDKNMKKVLDLKAKHDLNLDINIDNKTTISKVTKTTRVDENNENVLKSNNERTCNSDLKTAEHSNNKIANRLLTTYNLNPNSVSTDTNKRKTNNNKENVDVYETSLRIDYIINRFKNIVISENVSDSKTKDTVNDTASSNDREVQVDSVGSKCDFGNGNINKVLLYDDKAENDRELLLGSQGLKSEFGESNINKVLFYDDKADNDRELQIDSVGSKYDFGNSNINKVLLYNDKGKNDRESQLDSQRLQSDFRESNIDKVLFYDDKAKVRVMRHPRLFLNKRNVAKDSWTNSESSQKRIFSEITENSVSDRSMNLISPRSKFLMKKLEHFRKIKELT